MDDSFWQGLGVAQSRDDLQLRRKLSKGDRLKKISINCPNCQSHKIRKNGHRRGKQNYQCQSCGRQFIEYYSEVGNSQHIKEYCLTLYLNGNGFRSIERITQVNQNTIIPWVKQIVN